MNDKDSNDSIVAGREDDSSAANTGTATTNSNTNTSTSTNANSDTQSAAVKDETSSSTTKTAQPAASSQQSKPSSRTNKKQKDRSRQSKNSPAQPPATDLSSSDDGEHQRPPSKKSAKKRANVKSKGTSNGPAYTSKGSGNKHKKSRRLQPQSSDESSDSNSDERNDASDNSSGDDNDDDDRDEAEDEVCAPRNTKQKQPAKCPLLDSHQVSALQRQVAELQRQMSNLTANVGSSQSPAPAYHNYPLAANPGNWSHGGSAFNPHAQSPYADGTPQVLNSLPLPPPTINNWNIPGLRAQVKQNTRRQRARPQYQDDVGYNNDSVGEDGHEANGPDSNESDGNRDPPADGRKPEDTKKQAKKMDFKRVDQIWDKATHQYKLQETTADKTDWAHNGFLFLVRRTFDWEGKHRATLVDIKSKAIRQCLQEVIGEIKGVSLVEDTPKLDPNLLFLYLEDLRAYRKTLKDMEPVGKSRKERKASQAWLDLKRRHLKVLIKYLDKDYDKIKKSLLPLLENGLITFDLVWALWKPKTLAYTPTYGVSDQPRVFKVDMAEKNYSVLRGEFYYIDGKYLEFDGKKFGHGDISGAINYFQGSRKINSLGVFPLKYYKNADQVRSDLIERGKKFVQLGGMNYKSHQGLAFYRKRKGVVRVNVNGRVMIDPSTHRRNNPNYPVSQIQMRDQDTMSDDDDSDDDCGSDSDDAGHLAPLDYDPEEERETNGKPAESVTKVYKDDKEDIRKVKVGNDSVNSPTKEGKISPVTSSGQAEKDSKSPSEKDGAGEKTTAEKKIPVLSDEDYLIASPVVLGFSFVEKLWLEFTVSGIKEITWNEKAYDSLVLEPKVKSIVKALVESHKYHAAESIDDVIQGKGKGLVAVLHGPPGTGKTLTAEGISELLKCPLYMVSAGDLGTDSRYLEAELQKTLDICHTWGAILLLDEADVFLEKRTMHDIHRNALVSIFLRQLEYFQGILFLTTNRVETFDDAFQSRIHIALRYGKLELKAKKAIFRIFLDRVREQAKIPPATEFTEANLVELAKHDLNGRQIKNTVATAQALAVNQGAGLGMSHIRQVIEVARDFERDLKGGPGFEDAMKSYF